MKRYETFELTFSGPEPEGSQALADIQAKFSCGDETWNVKGFYDGNGTYKVRFLPQKEGHYTWAVSGVVNASGEEDCTVSETAHGMVQAEGTHFVYQDGTKYLPFGTTIYALAHQSEELIEQTLNTLSTAPFNKVRHCIFPKHYDYNHNEPQFYPFEKDADGKWDVHRPCFAYWAHFEKILNRLGEMGIETDLILFHPYDRWGFSKMSMEENKVYLDYALRRLAAIPYIWWSMANEYDLMFHLSENDWFEIEDTIVKNDPYGHLLSNHNCIKFYDFSRPAITHVCVQTIAFYKAAEWMDRYQKPVVYDEFCYEGDIQHEWGNISAFEMTNRFWKACSVGAYATHGETFFSEDEILWWARGGVLKGESPKRIAFLKDLLYSLPSPVEPWNEPRKLEPGQEEEPVNAAENPFIHLFNSVTDENAECIKMKGDNFNGHCGDDAFLKYFSGHQPSISSINLPENASYRIDVIDVWNMTRETLIEKASGYTDMKLPGKEGIAVLAVKITE
ncbi:hypothetical protein B5F07_19900 [Lachnoclostridium sp. An169]|uniref:DUF5060 domain-containing protein n=1 Tax=Lachnoclostridium sp. An169 TaxID=1965569 RepID=UPI000B3A4A35|nr:DUF5060 domain-containing protein [Lachnoclostridium sp. An169]OUP80771.1 hypothetical protein B5F07_19900 [Lachnoclostridium sp. An169]